MCVVRPYQKQSGCVVCVIGEKKSPEKRVKIAILFCAWCTALINTHYGDYVDKVVNANHIRFDWITNSFGVIAVKRKKETN